jgi:hypothetical protein
MAKINDGKPTRAPQFPWDLRSIVRPKELERAGKVKKKGDPKNPALASAALLDFIGPAHNADELRLPLPPMPDGHDADLAAFTDRSYVNGFLSRGSENAQALTEELLSSLRASPERLERLNALLGRENQMMLLVRHYQAEKDEIERKRREETDENI